MGHNITIYNLAFVFFENNYDFKNFLSANDALSTFSVLILISLYQSFLTFSIASRYWRTHLLFQKLRLYPPRLKPFTIF